MKLVYLGPQGSYTEQAAQKAVLNWNVDKVQTYKASTIKQIIDLVDKNKGLVGIIPVENSIEGLVRETLDNIIRTKPEVKVFQEVVLPIKHCLISKNTDINKIEKIISHPQALAQCQQYLFDNFQSQKKEVSTIRSASTSEAVKSLLELDDSFAAIGSEKAAQLYGLNVIAKNINDEKDNKTRFICIAHESTTSTGNDKTSLAFTTLNEPGALVGILNIFKEHNINLSFIESRPSKKNMGEYTFFVDFDGHVSDANAKEVLEEIKPLTTFYRVIGSFPRYEEQKCD